jgi:uncharacterized protein with LGFP repeats
MMLYFVATLVSLCCGFSQQLIPSAGTLDPNLGLLFPLEVKAASLGSGFLGPPTSEERTSSDGTGTYRHYVQASIFYHHSTGAHEVHGSIRQLYQSLGYEQSFLGYPTTDETTTPDGVGKFNEFQGGTIYWHPSTGAHEVHGAIGALYKSLGATTSFLGYPTTDETTTPDGVGKFNEFQGGTIYWHPSTGAFLVYGAIGALYKSLGATQSYLGYPTSSELATPEGRGRYNNFQYGRISWSPELGAAVSSYTRTEVTPTGVRPLAVGGSVPEVRRRLNGRIFIYCVDDDAPDSDETGVADQLIDLPLTSRSPQDLGTVTCSAGK